MKQVILFQRKQFYLNDQLYVAQAKQNNGNMYFSITEKDKENVILTISKETLLDMKTEASTTELTTEDWLQLAIDEFKRQVEQSKMGNELGHPEAQDH